MYVQSESYSHPHQNRRERDVSARINHIPIHRDHFSKNMHAQSESHSHPHQNRRERDVSARINRRNRCPFGVQILRHVFDGECSKVLRVRVACVVQRDQGDCARHIRPKDRRQGRLRKIHAETTHMTVNRITKPYGSMK